jgi:hypothetical protein
MNEPRNRRALLKALAVAATLSPIILRNRSVSAADPELDVEWRVPEDQVKPLMEAIPLKKTDKYNQRNPLVIGAIILIGAALVPKIAQAIVDVCYRYKSGGVIIDTRSQPVVVSADPSVAPGYALIISKDGVKTIQLGGAQPVSAEDYKGLTEILLSAIKKG